MMALVLVGCGATGQPTAPATPTGVPPTSLPTARPSPSATATPLPPPPTFTPVAVTATPVPALPLRITAQLDPPTPRAGDEFVLALSVTNDGQRPAHGVYIATSGPWDRWTVLGVEPDGSSFARDAAGWHIISPIETPAAETRTILVHVRADEPAQEQLTFAVREAEPGELSPSQ